MNCAIPFQSLERAIPQRCDEPLHHRDWRLDEVGDVLQLDGTRPHVEITLPMEMTVVIPHSGVEHNITTDWLTSRQPSPLPFERSPCAQHSKARASRVQRDLCQLMP